MIVQVSAYRNNNNNKKKKVNQNQGSNGVCINYYMFMKNLFCCKKTNRVTLEFLQNKAFWLIYLFIFFLLRHAMTKFMCSSVFVEPQTRSNEGQGETKLC